MSKRRIKKNDNQNNKERKPRKQREERVFEGELDNKQRSAFRRTKRWKNHRLHIKKLQNGLDYITHKPLRKGFTCHHLSSDRSRYQELSDELQIDLNPRSHETLHTLFSWLCSDPKIIERMFEVLSRMYILNNGKDFE